MKKIFQRAAERERDRHDRPRSKGRERPSMSYNNEDEELSDVPFAEPYWYGTAPGGRGASSPYYKPKHEAFRAKVSHGFEASQ